MFHLSLYFALFATIVATTSRCEIVERGNDGFEARFYSYELGNNVGWNPGFFQDGGYNKGEALYTASGVKRINFRFCDDSHDIRYDQIYGQQTTVSNYTIELTGYFTPTSTGIHKFYVQAENGVSLQISRGLSCCNSPKGGAHGDYELHMLDNGNGEGSRKEDNFHLEDGVRYFIKIVTFNGRASGGLKVGFFTPNNEHAAELGTMIFQDKYDTKPCPDSPNSLPESLETTAEDQMTKCSSCPEVATASNDFESTSTESTASSMHDAVVPPVAATISTHSNSPESTDDCIQCSSTESVTSAVKSSEEISEAASTTAQLSTQSLEPEVSSNCESCSSSDSKKPSLDARPTTSEKFTSADSSACIDIESALLDMISTSKQGTTSLEHSTEYGQSNLVSSSADQGSQETMETTSQGKEESRKTQDVPKEKVTATTSTQHISESEPSVSPVSGSILPDSVDKSVDTSAVQNTPELKASGAVSASAEFAGKVSTKSSSEVAVSTSESTEVASTKSWTSSHVESGQPEAETSRGQSASLTKASTDTVSITSCTEDCPAENATSCTEDCEIETSTTYVTMTTTNESGKTVTVTYCPSTEQAQPSDICIAGDSVCLSYAASVNVFPTPASVDDSKAAEPRPSAAVSETKETQVMETGKKTEESNSSPSGSNTAANSQPDQSAETGSPTKVTLSGNSKETAPAKETSRDTPEDTVSVTVTSTTGSKAGPNSPVPSANSFENGAGPIAACASFNVLASLAAALISLLVFA